MTKAHRSTRQQHQQHFKPPSNRKQHFKPVCRTGAEDIKHMIFTCDRAKAVWSSIGLGQKIADLLIVDRSGSIVLEEVIRGGEQVQRLDVGLAELILTGGWFLWWERRQIVHGESVQRPARSGLSIVSLTKNYKQAAGMVTQIR